MKINHVYMHVPSGQLCLYHRPENLVFVIMQVTDKNFWVDWDDENFIDFGDL